MTTLLPSSVPVHHRRLLPWAALAVALTALNLRTAVTGITPLLEIIGDDLGFGLALAGLLGTVPAATFGVFGFFAPVLTRRFGLERTACLHDALQPAMQILAALVVTHLGLLFWELRYVSASLAHPGLTPPTAPVTLASKERRP